VRSVSTLLDHELNLCRIIDVEQDQARREDGDVYDGHRRTIHAGGLQSGLPSETSST